jgi:hypothetical protein
LAKKVFLPEPTSLVIEDSDLDEDLIDLLVDPLERRTLYGNITPIRSVAATAESIPWQSLSASTPA